MSKYIRHACCFSAASNDDEAWLAWLRDTAGRIGQKSVLIPTTDDGALMVSRHANWLQQFFLFPALPLETAQGLCSKKEMYFLAKRHAIPTPECVFPQSRPDVVDYANSGMFPVMLKGVDGKRLERIAGKRMFLIRSKAELLATYDRCQDDPANPNVMLQEYIPGGDDSVWLLNGYFNGQSQCLFDMTGKKIHQYPIHTGLTSLGVCRHNPEVAQLTHRFMQAVGYQGILDIGFRYDARDGQYKVLDVNPRIGATFRLFVGDNGLDVVRSLYLDLTGQPVPHDTVCEGRKWLVEDIDFISSIKYLLKREVNLSTLLDSYSQVRESAFFALDDPLPFAMMLVNLFQKSMQPKRSNPDLSAGSAVLNSTPKPLSNN